MWIIPKLIRIEIEFVCHNFFPQCADIGTGNDSIGRGEKWLAFDVEQEKVIEKHISSR